MLGTLSKILPRVEVPPEWGIDPVPPLERRMTFRQHFVLWFNLGSVCSSSSLARCWCCLRKTMVWAWPPGKRCWR